jgi:hypothetical protein
MSSVSRRNGSMTGFRAKSLSSKFSATCCLESSSNFVGEELGRAEDKHKHLSHEPQVVLCASKHALLNRCYSTRDLRVRANHASACLRMQPTLEGLRFWVSANLMTAP